MHPPAITLHPGCKVNIYLDILGRRENGYHDLLTLFLPLSTPQDDLTVEGGMPGSGLRIDCTGREIGPGENILHRAYGTFCRRTDTAPDLHVRLEKRIPMGAGLGGGSSNAAALLLYMNRHCLPAPLGESELLQLAAAVGADVPFFLLNRPAWAQGIGDVLYPAEVSLEGCSLVLVCPDLRISTAWAYEAWDQAADSRLTGQESKDIFTDWPNVLFYNCFERVVFPAFPSLREIKERLLGFGASAAVLSGSGSSILAVFREPRSLESALGWMDHDGLEHYSHSFANS